MALDQRQTQIREGAGLEESRLNREFIDFLQKWSMPLLVIVAVVAVGYAFKQRYDRAQKEKLELAFGELEAASASARPSPDTLRTIADEYQSITGVYLKGSLRAGDAYLDTVRSGVKPGAELKADGSLAKVEDKLSESDRAYHLAQAQAMYDRVYADTAGKPEYTLMRLGAVYGLAAVLECKGEFDGAKLRYEEIVQLTDKGPWGVHAGVARARLASMDGLKDLPRLYRSDELPKPPEPPKVDTPAPAAPGDAPKTEAPAADPATPLEAPKTDGAPVDAPKDEPKPTETPATEPVTPPATPPADPPADPKPPEPSPK
ncbi:MAG: hypothetical protein JNL50_03815 [Phycisphaerae bacterium]|nr:hypothetical protein [Phycisphaerae bacterium]